MSLLIYPILLIGLYMFFEEELRVFFKYLPGTSKPFFRHEEKLKRQAAEKSSVKLLLASTLGVKNDRAVTYFIGCSVIFALSATYISAGRVSIGWMLITSVTFLLLPYTLLNTKLKIGRIANSNEGDIIISELLNNYKFTGYNMRAAVEYTAHNVSGAPNMKNVMLDLSKDLNLAGDEDDIKRSLKKFRYRVNSSWANLLSSNIYLAVQKKIVVTDSLTDLLKAMVSSKSVKEHLKRESNEAELMIKYMAPICYVLSVLGGIKFFDLSVEKYISYQFFTETGLRWFSIVVITYCIGLTAKLYLGDNRLDI